MFKKNFLLSVGLLLLVGSATTADPFELNGPGNQIYEDELVGDEQVKPGGVITATISNELALVGYFGRNGSRASVTHVTNNP